MSTGRVVLFERDVVPVLARVRATVDAALPERTIGGRLFWRALLEAAPATVSAGEIDLDLHHQTLRSRLARAGLPTPKVHLAYVRYGLTAGLLAAGFTAHAVAYGLNHSTPQSLCRHLRRSFGTNGPELRRLGLDGALERVAADLLRPHAATWATFDPLAEVNTNAWPKARRLALAGQRAA